jgi:hypothetical protein
VRKRTFEPNVRSRTKYPPHYQYDDPMEFWRMHWMGCECSCCPDVLRDPDDKKFIANVVRLTPYHEQLTEEQMARLCALYAAALLVRLVQKTNGRKP